ncbi:hypothetical protein Tco_0567749 [Tanacetum coccineum]
MAGRLFYYSHFFPNSSKVKPKGFCKLRVKNDNSEALLQDGRVKIVTQAFSLTNLKQGLLMELRKAQEMMGITLGILTEVTQSVTSWIASLAIRIMPPRKAPKTITIPATTTTTTSVTNAQLQAMIDQGVTAALAARDANRNGDDNHTSGTGVRRTERVARECTYQDFMKCQTLYFKGTKGVFELTQWFERMETVFRISHCSVENQIKFSTCTLLAGALMWWNSHVRIVGHDVAYAMTWT